MQPFNHRLWNTEIIKLSKFHPLQQVSTNFKAKSSLAKVKLTRCSNPWECRHPEQAQISQRESSALPACKITQTQLKYPNQTRKTRKPKFQFKELSTCNPEECSEPKDFRYSAPCRASSAGFSPGLRRRRRSSSSEDCSTLGCTSSCSHCYKRRTNFHQKIHKRSNRKKEKKDRKKIKAVILGNRTRPG